MIILKHFNAKRAQEVAVVPMFLPFYFVDTLAWNFIHGICGGRSWVSGLLSSDSNARECATRKNVWGHDTLAVS